MTAVAACPMPASGFDFMSPVGGGESLDEVFAESQERLSQWRKDRAQAVHREAQRGLQELQRERSQLDDFHSDLENVSQLSEAAARLRAEGDKLGQVVRRSAEASAQRAEAVAHARDRLCAEQEARLQELKEAEAALASEEELRRAKGAEIESFLAMYAERLGLVIARVAPQTVKMTFTLIDEDELGREFSFTLGISETSGFRVFDVTPAVPQLDALLTRLQADPSSPTALPVFVCGMRRAFQDAANSMRPAHR